MNPDEIQPLVNDLVDLWKKEKGSSPAALETDESSLPLDYYEVGDETAAALGTVAPPENHSLLVAEGDSWFDYPGPGKGDLLDVLRKNHGYTIHQVSKAGALLEEMVYGSDRRFWGPSRPQIIRTMDKVSQVRPSLVMISGGGNDIAGDELIAFINRKAPNVAPLREGAIEHIIFTVFRRAYEVFIRAMQQIAQDEEFELKILGHNYDFPNPDGRGYSLSGLIPGFSYVGPWLKPAFARKGYTTDEGRTIVQQILEKFTLLQQQLSDDYPGVFYTVNLQGTLNPVSTLDWDNEMHPTWQGFSQIGQKVHAAIQQIS